MITHSSRRNGKAYQSLVRVEQIEHGLNSRRFILQGNTRFRSCLQVGSGLYYPSTGQWVVYFKKPWTRDNYRLYFTSEKEMMDFIWYILNTKRSFWKKSVQEAMTNGKLSNR